MSKVDLKGIETMVTSTVSPKVQSALEHRGGLCFFNRSRSTVTIYLEPWGADYSLLPNENFEVVLFDRHTVPWLDFSNDDEDSIQAWCEADSYEVVQNGVVLECGHHRPEDRSGGFQT